jgi:pimeloyl-ACP methyl ester carboxylesterase
VTTAQPRTGSAFVTSADGTRIAYESTEPTRSTGSGPALVLVDGALCSRSMGPSQGLAKQLRDRFTVIAYDRRGRGESGPGVAAYDPRREVEDLVAVLGATGGRAHVLGVSSGAALALEAARCGAPIDRLVCYEAPFILDGSQPPTDPRLPEQVARMVAEGRRGEAVATFLKVVGAPAPVRVLMRLAPAWKQMTAVAHTLPYDLALVVPFGQGRPLPAGHYDDVPQQTLVLAGGRSPASMRNAQAAVAAALPHGRLEVLRGQTHMVKATVVAPVVSDHLLS